MGIKNGKDINLSQTSGTLPDVSGAMQNWFQSMTFTTITKTLVNFSVVETSASITVPAVIQPYTIQQLQIRPEGERAFRWFTLHSDSALQLNVDDVVVYQTRKFRVMERGEYASYGYMEYHIIEDYQ